MSGDGGGDTAAGDRGLADIAPPRNRALVGRALAPDFVDSRECLFADARDVDGFRRVGHFVERGDGLFRLVARLARASEHGKQGLIVRGVAGQSEFRDAADGQPFDVVVILRPLQQLDHPDHRAVTPGREVIAPQDVEDFRARLQHHLAARAAGRRLDAKVLAQFVVRGGGRSDHQLIEPGERSNQIFVDHRLPRRNSRFEFEQELFPVRQARIGDRADDDPMIIAMHCQRLRNYRVGFVPIGAEDAGKEPDINSGPFRIAECAKPAQGDHGRRHSPGIGVAAVAVDPTHHRIGRREIDRLRRRCGCQRNEQQRDNSGKQAAHVPSASAARRR